MCNFHYNNTSNDDTFKYRGIQSITSDKCNRLYGINEWIYPYLVLQNEDTTNIPSDVPPDIIELLDEQVFPPNYDRSKAGVYVIPLYGKLIRSN